MSATSGSDLRQFWPRPTSPRPIVIIGCGDIVRDAHIPAYNKAGFKVAGVFDLDRERAEERAKEAGGATVFASLEEAMQDASVVFDVATPPTVHRSVLEKLPEGSTVLLQKPMGNHYEEAQAIARVCRDRKLTVAVNFQLRFSPQMLALKDFVDRGGTGQLVDIDVHLRVETPWGLFPFLEKLDRVEIQVHTVHHLDFIRHLAGNPRRVYARTVRHPAFPKLAQTKTSIILDYGDYLRCSLAINHCHTYGDRHQDARIRVEGVDGAADTRLGLLLDYPRGKPDTLEVTGPGTDGWQEVKLEGAWFPDAFMGTMSNLQRFAAGEDHALISPVEDALHTMAVVEACYESDAHGGVPPRDGNEGDRASS